MKFDSGSPISGEVNTSSWTKFYQNNLNKWSWDTKTTDHVGNPVRRYFNPGVHTIRFAGRSKYHAIDRVALYKYDSRSFTESYADSQPQSPIS